MSEIVEGSRQPSERDVMRAFIARWETKLNEQYEQMGREAKALGYQIEGSYGGSTSSFTGKTMRSRIELKVML